MNLSAIAENPRVYNGVQYAAGSSLCRRWLAPTLAELANGSLLDVGAGTGLYADLIPRSTRYVALDVDPGKLGRLAEAHPRAETIVGDATRLPFPDGAFDYTTCFAVAHHLPSASVLIGELARVTRLRCVLWDALKSARLLSRGMWKIDQGGWPHTREELTDAFTQQFASVKTSEFTWLHRYLLLDGTT